MGRGGYNGGGPSVEEPQDDNLYIFPDVHRKTLLQRSRIVQAGENLKNEGGGVQHEFGYLLRVSTNATAQSEEASLFSRIFCRVRSTTRRSLQKDIRWIAASDLLSRTPEGTTLARDYHLSNPKAPRPWGFKCENANAGCPSA